MNLIKTAKFEILKTKNKQFYFVFKSTNGEVLLTSETYKSKQSCKKAIKAIKINSLFSKTIDLS